MKVQTLPQAPPVPRRPLVDFSVDEGAHPDAKTEWWYVHGYLEDDQHRTYGFMHALFDNPDCVNARYNVDLPAMPGATMMDLSLTEETAGKQTHHREMRIIPPFWSHSGIREDKLDESYKTSEGKWNIKRMDSQTFEINGPTGHGSLDIRMKPTKPPLLMGGEGEIKMGPLGKSKYYTIPRMEVEGTLKIDGEERHVKGSGWMDHQWGDMQMFHGYEGWDWFGIQLDNQTEVNAFHFRGPEHSTASATVGVSLPDGQQAVTEKLKLSPGRTWTSPETGITYPVEWHISVPDQELELDVKPSLDSQEMIGSRPFCYPELALKPTYWEGSTRVEGTMHGKPVKGRAYMELTGYASPSPFSNDYADLAQQLSKEAEEAGHAPAQPAQRTGTTPPLSAAP